jgi:hypothetical protein
LVPAANEQGEVVPGIAGIRLVEAARLPPRKGFSGAPNVPSEDQLLRNPKNLQGSVRSSLPDAAGNEVAARDGGRVVVPILSTIWAWTPLQLELPFRQARETFERAYFEQFLAREGGSRSRVAEKTGMDRSHLYRKLKALGIKAGKDDESP